LEPEALFPARFRLLYLSAMLAQNLTPRLQRLALMLDHQRCPVGWRRGAAASHRGFRGRPDALNYLPAGWEKWRSTRPPSITRGRHLPRLIGQQIPDHVLHTKRGLRFRQIAEWAMQRQPVEQNGNGAGAVTRP
jgi:hypothetical protein